MSIRDLTTYEVLFDSWLNDEIISMSGGVITHTHVSSNQSQEDTDELQIFIDIGNSPQRPIHIEERLTSIGEGQVAVVDSCIGSSESIIAGPYVILSNCVAIQPASPGVRMRAVSDDAEDSLAGTGAQKLKLTYFTESPWEMFTEVVEMDGTTPINTDATDIYRLNKVEVVQGGPAAGIITLESTDGAILYAQIDQYETFFERAIFYVQDGEQAIVTDIFLGCSTNGGVTWRLFLSDEDEESGEVVTRGQFSVHMADDILHIPLKVPRKVSNPNGKRIAIGLAVQGPVAAQKGTGTISGYCKKIGT